MSEQQQQPPVEMPGNGPPAAQTQNAAPNPYPPPPADSVPPGSYPPQPYGQYPYPYPAYPYPYPPQGYPPQGYPPPGYPPAPGYPPQTYPPQGYPSQGPYPPQAPPSPQPAQAQPESTSERSSTPVPATAPAATQPAQAGTAQPPAPFPGYPYPPPQGYPGGYPAPQPGASPYGTPPPGGYPGHPPQGYPPQQYAPPNPQAIEAPTQFPVYGYPQAAPAGAPQNLYGSPSPTYKSDIQAIYRATKGMRCDVKTLIQILAGASAATIEAIRTDYVVESGASKDLIKTIHKESLMDNTLKLGLKALAYGPIQSEAFWARHAISGVGTNEPLLTESLLGKQPHELAAIRRAYAEMFGKSLEEDTKKDLSGSTKKLFKLAFEAVEKPLDWTAKDEVKLEDVERDCKLIKTATVQRIGTDDIQVQVIFMKSSEAYLKALTAQYQKLYGKSLRSVIEKEFSGHQRFSLLWILDGVLDRATRDAISLEESMAGIGTRDVLLISRLIRIHWTSGHMEKVKQRYFEKYQRDLGARVRGETSGSLEKLCVKLVEG